jgi:uncharacterized protein
MSNFEWDENKNKSNQQKHGVGFEEAQEVFEDENAIEFSGNTQNELRILRIGKTFGKMLLSVVYTVRVISIRIISARQASKPETMSYLDNVLSQQQSEDESKSSTGN